MKPYHQIPIIECHEPLVPIPLERFAVFSPHPYIKVGADYGTQSPYFLRQGVLDALLEAQEYLQETHPGWRIQIFDAYRPVEIQQYMVDYTFGEVLREKGLDAAQLSPQQKEEIWQQVYQIWAIPSDDPATPPPHSTGSAVDITLVNEEGETVEMGSEIDELSARSRPDYYTNATTPEKQGYHSHRELLNTIMVKAGFERHPGEWWHFSLGDQMWVWLRVLRSADPWQDRALTARYGKVRI